MKDEKKTEIKVGLTVTFAILLLFFVIGWAKNISIGAARKHLDVQFISVSGLEVGDPVTLNGVRKGYVDVITNNNKQGVLVDLSLDSDVQLRKDARVSIDMLDLMGGKKVEIAQGNADQFLDFSKPIQGDFSADVPLMMKTAGSIVNQLPELVNSLNESLTAIKGIVQDDKLKSDVKTTMSELRDMTVKLDRFVDNNSSSVAALINNSNKLVSEAGTVMQENKTDVKESIQNLKELTKTTGKLIEKISLLVDETQGQKNNLGKIMYDESLVPELKQTLATLKELLTVLNSQLQKDGVNVKAKFDLF
jgi:phospholipid/cholesterol/gamma-HCH transport system substrate-binding protein